MKIIDTIELEEKIRYIKAVVMHEGKQYEALVTVTCELDGSAYDWWAECDNPEVAKWLEENIEKVL